MSHHPHHNSNYAAAQRAHREGAAEVVKVAGERHKSTKLTGLLIA